MCTGHRVQTLIGVAAELVIETVVTRRLGRRDAIAGEPHSSGADCPPQRSVAVAATLTTARRIAARACRATVAPSGGRASNRARCRGATAAESWSGTLGGTDSQAHCLEASRDVRLRPAQRPRALCQLVSYASRAGTKVSEPLSSLRIASSKTRSRRVTESICSVPRQRRGVDHRRQASIWLS